MAHDTPPRRRLRPTGHRPLAVETLIADHAPSDVLAYAKVAAAVLARLALKPAAEPRAHSTR